MQKLVGSDDGLLKSPAQRKQELEQAKTKVKEFQEFRANYQQVNRRNRMVNSAWRNGIAGVENPEDQNSDFYQARKSVNDFRESEKGAINSHRTDSKYA